jgi:hypothetical protein
MQNQNDYSATSGAADTKHITTAPKWDGSNGLNDIQNQPVGSDAKKEIRYVSEASTSDRLRKVHELIDEKKKRRQSNTPKAFR